MYVDRPTPLLAQNDRRRVGKMGAQKAPAAAHGRAGGHFPAAGNQKVGGIVAGWSGQQRAEFILAIPRA